MTQAKMISAAGVKAWLSEPGEIAFLDLREHGQYGEGHPFLVVSAPFSRLEIDVPRLVPRRSTRIVLLDQGDGVALRALPSLSALGYSDLWVLEGGAPGWEAAGYQLFKGVNLPSKTFGELAEHHFDTPRISAKALAERQARGEKLLILDGRPKSEHYKMTIPGAICCPNGELAYRIHRLVEDETTPVIIHCAGRTRSIIGAQSLINLGLPNPVYALENGTQGWFLEDLALEHESRRAYPDVAEDEAGLSLNRSRAAALSRRFGLREAGAEELALWQGEEDRTTVYLDIRSPEEVAADPVPGAIHAPGGQLLQSTDQYIGTRGARLVLLDHDALRAPVVASWLSLMGQEVWLLPRALAPLPAPPAAAPAVTDPAPDPAPARLDPRDYAKDPAAFLLIDLRPSSAFRAGHIRGAKWSVRPRLAADLAAALAGQDRIPLFVADDAALLALALRELSPALRARALWLEGTTRDHAAAGLAIVEMADFEGRHDHIDYLFFVHDRHDGNKEAARQYLAWETGLIAQLDAAERGIFRLTPSDPAPEMG